MTSHSLHAREFLPIGRMGMYSFAMQLLLATYSAVHPNLVYNLDTMRYKLLYYPDPSSSTIQSILLLEISGKHRLVPQLGTLNHRMYVGEEHRETGSKVVQESCGE